MRGIYIASQLLSNSTNVNFADLNQTTRITYDKGGVWTHLHAPYQDSQGDYSHCYWVSRPPTAPPAIGAFRDLELP